MVIETQIGEAAGRVWHLLDGNGPQTLAEIKLKLKLRSDITSFGIGWLAREDKIEVTDERKGFRVRLR